MKAIDILRTNEIWDNRFDLPTCRITGNPWLYMAYADAVCRIKDGSMLDRKQVFEHFKKCEVKGEDGIFHLFPGKSKLTSHDEIIGAAYFEPQIAQRILVYLDQHGGVWNNTTDPSLNRKPFRMVFLKPYLFACAGWNLGIREMATYSAFIATDMCNGDVGGRLRNWLMFQKMFHVSKIFRAAIKKWRGRMEAKKLTLKGCLAIEPHEYPIISELAGERWTVYGE